MHRANRGVGMLNCVWCPASRGALNFQMPFDPNASFGKSLFFGTSSRTSCSVPGDAARSGELVQPICETIDKYMAEIDTRKLDG